MNNDNSQSESWRLAKFLAACGIASRRSCEELIREGRVVVNGEVILTPAFCVDPEKDRVEYDGNKLSLQEKIYLLLNKPVAYTCSANDPFADRLVYELIPQNFGRLFSIGRLDRDSEGLLILTNDGELAHNLTHPSKLVPKLYLVQCKGKFSNRSRKMMLDGIHSDGEFLQAKEVKRRSGTPNFCTLEITLTSGKNREVRRLCDAVGLEVQNLQRIAFAEIKLSANLKPGGWRKLNQKEINILKNIAEEKINTRKNPRKR